MSTASVPNPTMTSWLRVLWSQVLFPGAAPDDCRPRIGAILILLVLPAALLYPSLGFHLFEPDEGRYAQIPREMLARGDWVVPHLQGEPYLDKPPLLYWLVMVSYSIFGAADWSARLAPALAVHAAILVLYLVGRRSVGERPAFWGALLLALAPGFLSVGRLLVLDGLLAFLVTTALLCALEALRTDRLRWSWWLVSALACGLGVLTKGPISLILLAPPLLAYRWLSAPAWKLPRGAILAYLAVVVLTPLPWYVAMSLRVPGFLTEFFWKHNVVRFLSPFDHLEPVWFYAPILLAGLLPGTLLLVPAFRFLLTADADQARQRPPALGFLLLAGLWCVLFFSLSGCKLATYVLPAFPPLALALGCALTARGWQQSRWTLTACTGAFAFLFSVHQVMLPWYAEFRSPYGEESDIARLAGDPETPVVCYPRSCDSLAFYLNRSDFQSFRSKETPELVQFLRTRPRTVVLFTHRHSLNSLRLHLPANELKVADEIPLYDSARAGVEGFKYLLNQSPLGDGSRDSKAGLCYAAVIEQVGR